MSNCEIIVLMRKNKPSNRLWITYIGNVVVLTVFLGIGLAIYRHYSRIDNHPTEVRVTPKVENVDSNLSNYYDESTGFYLSNVPNGYSIVGMTVGGFARKEVLLTFNLVNSSDKNKVYPFSVYSTTTTDSESWIKVESGKFLPNGTSVQENDSLSQYGITSTNNGYYVMYNNGNIYLLNDNYQTTKFEDVVQYVFSRVTIFKNPSLDISSWETYTNDNYGLAMRYPKEYDSPKIDNRGELSFNANCAGFTFQKKLWEKSLDEYVESGTNFSEPLKSKESSLRVGNQRTIDLGSMGVNEDKNLLVKANETTLFLDYN